MLNFNNKVIRAVDAKEVRVGNPLRKRRTARIKNHLRCEPADSLTFFFAQSSKSERLLQRLGRSAIDDGVLSS